MFGLSDSELLFYGGIGIMVTAAAAAFPCIIIFRHRGKRLKERLKQEYGELRQ